MNTFTKELLNVSDVVLRNDEYLFVWNHAFLHDACVPVRVCPSKHAAPLLDFRYPGKENHLAYLLHAFGLKQER